MVTLNSDPHKTTGHTPTKRRTLSSSSKGSTSGTRKGKAQLSPEASPSSDDSPSTDDAVLSLPDCKIHGPVDPREKGGKKGKHPIINTIRHYVFYYFEQGDDVRILSPYCLSLGTR